MLNLILTTDKLSVITSAAVTVDTHASFVDVDTGTGGVFTPGKQNTAISTATTTDVVASPSSGQVRNVKWISIRNKDATNPTDITIQFNANGTLYQLYKVTLLKGEEAVCREGIWFHFDVNGGQYNETALRLADSRFITKALLADLANSTVTTAEVTGLTVALPVGIWGFKYLIRYQTAATTTGIAFAVNHTGTVAHFLWNQYWVDVSATASTAAPDQDSIVSTGTVLGAFGSRAKATTGRGVTLSVDTATTDMFMIIEGMCEVTVSGNLQLYSASEVAASAATVKQGTILSAWSA